MTAPAAVRRFVLAGSTLMLSVLSAGAAPLDADRAAALPAADVYVLGEVHDNPAHHRGQGAVVAAVRPTAVVFEMLTPDQAAHWDPALTSSPDVLDGALGWTASGWPDPAIYMPLFGAIPTGAAVIGGALEPEDVRSAVGIGARAVLDAAHPGAAARFGLDEPLAPEEQAAREAEQQAAHCGVLPEDLLPGFVEAQRLRDAALAHAVLQALEAHGPPVVLVAGNGHARTDWGVPALLAHAVPDVAVLSIGQYEEGAGADPVDMAVVTPGPPESRANPCATFVPPAGDP